jgi:GntR family transcriptional regulator of arabinose operon
MSKKVPMYHRIFADYKARIVSGELKANERLPSESEMAELYGVSRITSKRSMEELYREGLIYRRQGQGSFVARKLTVDKGGGPTSKTSGICGMCIPFDTSLGRSVDLIRGTSDYLGRKGFLLSVQISDFDSNKEREIIRNFSEHGVNGLILYPVFDKVNLDMLYELTLDNFPIVTVDKYIDGLPIQSVITDNFEGAKAAVEYLIERGHTRIGFLSDLGLGDSPTVRDRFFGFCRALRDQGLPVQNEHCRFGFIKEIEAIAPDSVDVLRFKKPMTPAVMDFFKGILKSVLEGADPVTAIFCLNDYIAVVLMKCALEVGIKIPEQLSIIGYDNIDISKHVEVPLTTMEQNLYEMGYDAARLLVRQITGATPAKAEAVTMLPVRIIERDSVMDLRKLPEDRS